MEIKLNKEQKEFLFNEGYVTAKTLDACVEQSWKDYFMNEFVWALDTQPDKYDFLPLRLIEANPAIGDDPFVYNIGLNFQGTDLQTLLAIK